MNVSGRADGAPASLLVVVFFLTFLSCNDNSMTALRSPVHIQSWYWDQRLMDNTILLLLTSINDHRADNTDINLWHRVTA